MKEVLNSYMEELSADDVRQDQESNVGLVIDGEVCQQLSYQHPVSLCMYIYLFMLSFLHTVVSN